MFLKAYISRRNLLHAVLLASVCMLSYRAFADRNKGELELGSMLSPSIKDSTGVKKLLERGNYLIDYNVDSAALVLDHALSISRKIRYTYGIARANQLSGVIYSDKGEYAVAASRYKDALKHFLLISDHRGIGAVNNNLGNLNNYQGLLDEAVVHYLLAVNAFQRAGEQQLVSLAYTNLGSVFEKLKQSDKSLYYHQKAVEISDDLKDSARLIHALINQGIAYSNLNRTGDAMQSFHRSLLFSRVLENAQGIGIASQNIGDLYESHGNYDSAVYYFEQSKAALEKLNDPYYTSAIYYALGSVYIHTGKINVGKQYIHRAIDDARRIGEKEILARAFFRLSELYAQTGQFQKSVEALNQYKLYDDSLRSASTIQQVNMLETRFRTAEKDKEIAGKQLALSIKETELREKNLLIGCIIGALIIAVIISLLLFRTYRQQKSLNEQQRINLQKEHQIIALQAMMDGEEKERTRLSRDLHDGVAGLLSATKMHMHSLEKIHSGLNDTPLYHKTVHMLDEAAIELRKTAHNLMPQVLHEYGLAEGVRHCCSRYSGMHHPDIQVEVCGEAIRYPSRFELMVFRVVQELLHNAIKHSGATSIVTQLSFTPGLLAVTVEDDGRGFDPAALVQGAGMGLGSLQSRVAALDGRLDLRAAPGKGCSVYIEFDTSLQKLAS